MKRKIKSSTLIRRVRALAEKYPDAHIDSSAGVSACSYATTPIVDGPSTLGCLIGQAGRGLIAWPKDLITTVIDDSKFDELINFETTEQRQWLAKTQRGQDAGMEWAKAVQGADRLWPSP
jgi:hypothetical protein